VKPNTLNIRPFRLDSEQTLEYIHKIVNDIILNYRKYRPFVVDKLLERHNDF